MAMKTAAKSSSSKSTVAKASSAKKAPAKKPARKTPASKTSAASSPSKSSSAARKYSQEASKSVEREMKAMHKGKLKSGSGEKVTNPKQAIAIGLSEARRAGEKVPPDPNR